MESRAKAGVAIAVGAVVMAAVGGVVAWRHGVFDRPSSPVTVERFDTGTADQSEGPSVGHAEEVTADQSQRQSVGQSAEQPVGQSGAVTDERSAPSSVPVAEWRVAPMTVFYRGGDGVSVRAEAPRPMSLADEPTHQPPRPMEAPSATAPAAIDAAVPSGPKPMTKDDFFR